MVKRPEGVKCVLELPDVEVSRLGGDVAVDFFNTVAWRRDPARRSERLASYGHVISWMAASGLIGDREATSFAALADRNRQDAKAEYDLLVELREDTYDALVEGRPPVVLQRRLVQAHSRSELVRGPDDRWSWMQPEPDLGTPGDRLALELERLLTSDAVAWFHRCEDQHCGWVFLDTSRLHNRRWCSAADCGNRNRARTHYNRLKTASGRQER